MGYLMLILPDWKLWQGFQVPSLSVTATFVSNVRHNIQYLSYDPRHFASIPRDFALSDEDAVVVATLASMLVHDAMALNITGICTAADAIIQVMNKPFFSVEGHIENDGDDDLIKTSIGIMRSNTIEMAAREAAFLGALTGY
jgi:hypothetical protein